MDQYPGYEFAKQNDYTLHSVTDEGKTAVYTKHVQEACLFLAIQKNNNALLSRIIGDVQCRVPFKLPSKAFDLYERQLASLFMVK